MSTISDKIINLWSKSRLLIVIFITLAIIMIASALTELFNSKKELINLMGDQAESLIASIMISSNNSLLTNEQFSAITEERLLNNAVLIGYLFENHTVSNALLNDFCKENSLYRINIFDNQGEKLFYSHEREHFLQDEKYSPKQLLEPIFSGMVDTLLIGIIPARYEEANRFSVAISVGNRSAIVVSIDAQKIIDFRQSIGFGPLLRDMVTENSSIIFAALQDTTTILAASGNVRYLESIQTSEFLSSSLEDTTFATRTLVFDSLEVFEVVHAFDYNDQNIGLLRLGLSMSPIHEINNRIYRRLFVITLVLFIVGSIIFAMIFTLQRLSILRKQYSTVETFSGNIIKNASDAIIVYNNTDGIKLFNRSAERIFNIKESKVFEKGLEELFNPNDKKIIDDKKLSVTQLECKINNREKYLLISKTEFNDDNDIQNTILLIRDLTEQRLMEEQLQRNQRLSAMGELASGVAHEIRNPLNTISTIVQQLDKDFSPKSNDDEYHDLSQIIYKEVNRIDHTVKEFLLFAKPEKVKPETFNINILFNDLQKQFKAVLLKNDTVMNIEQNWDGKVNWDFNKMKQVFINLIDNAKDAIKKEGTITINVNKIDNRIVMTIVDNGDGIRNSEISKVFNLYYTTKATGTGIGLSIVQRIIFEHKGTISIKSEKLVGTRITINLPISVN